MRPMTAGRRSFAPPLWGCTVSIRRSRRHISMYRQHREGHEALQGLLDIFSHRIMTQFYRIWRKYSWPPPLSRRHRSSLAVATGPGGARHSRHDAAYRLAGVALSGANRRAASAGQNPAGDPGAGHPAGPETTVRVSPYSLRRWRSASRWGFTAMTTSSWTAIRRWVTKRWMPAASSSSPLPPTIRGGAGLEA